MRRGLGAFLGIKIDTLDNSGWTITIDLEATPLEDVAFEETEIEYSHDNA